MFNQNMCCSKHIVAIVDILGAKRLMAGRDQNRSLNNVHFAYGFAQLIPNMKGYKVRVFSDNIVIAKSMDEECDLPEPSKTISDFLVFVGTCQWHLLELGYLSRGGVTIGEFYIDDIIVWGEALVNAHTIEEIRAIYPRIIIDDSILAIYDPPSGVPPMLAEDFDGEHFIDYLTFNLDCELPKFRHILDMVRSIASGVDDPRIMAKYRWYEKYHQRIYDNYDIAAWKERWAKVSPSLARID